MITTERSIDIEAPADRVWAVLGRFMHIDDFSSSSEGLRSAWCAVAKAATR